MNTMMHFRKMLNEYYEGYFKCSTIFLKEGVTMDMEELKALIYQGKKVDVECKKAELNVH